MRVEPCVCGGIIVAPSLKQSPPYVEAHNATPLHVLWRSTTGRGAWLDPRVIRALYAELVPQGHSS